MWVGKRVLHNFITHIFVPKHGYHMTNHERGKILFDNSRFNIQVKVQTFKGLVLPFEM